MNGDLDLLFHACMTWILDSSLALIPENNVWVPVIFMYAVIQQPEVRDVVLVCCLLPLSTSHVPCIIRMGEVGTVFSLLGLER